jgi:hypothetical protein
MTIPLWFTVVLGTLGSKAQGADNRGSGGLWLDMVKDFCNYAPILPKIMIGINAAVNNDGKTPFYPRTRRQSWRGTSVFLPLQLECQMLSP